LSRKRRRKKRRRNQSVWWSLCHKPFLIVCWCEYIFLTPPSHDLHGSLVNCVHIIVFFKPYVAPIDLLWMQRWNAVHWRHLLGRHPEKTLLCRLMDHRVPLKYQGPAEDSPRASLPGPGGTYKKSGEGLFIWACRDRRRGSGFKLEEGRFGVEIGKKFLM